MFDDIYNATPPSGATKTERMNSSAEIRKKKSKRNSYRIVMIISSVILCLLVIAALFFLRIKSVVIVNEGFYNTAEIEQAANDGVYRHMFFPRSDSLKEKLEKEFPYLTLDTETFVKDYSTQTLTVTAVYIDPAFCLEWNSKYLVISADCKVLDASATAPVDGIPIVTGVKLTSAEAGTHAAFANAETEKIITENLQMLKDAGIENVVELDISDTRDIKVYLSDGGTLLLGTSEISKTKTAYLRELYTRHKAENTANSYVIEIKNNKDGYVKILDETQPEETTEEEISETETSVTDETVTEEPEEETTEEESRTSSLYELQMEEENAEPQEQESEEESHTGSSLYELQMEEENAE